MSATGGVVPARRRAALVAVTALLALVAPLAARASASGVQTGVWWQGQAAAGTSPNPPQLPAGGLWVSGTAAGPSAISAMRFTLDAGDSNPVVTLAVANAATAPASPAGTGPPQVVVCAATASWKPTDHGSPGAWTDRPTYDCARQAVVSFAADGKSATLDLGAFAASASTIDVVLLPGTTFNPQPAPTPPLPVPPTPLGSIPDPSSSSITTTSDVTFNPVDVSAIAVTPGPASDTSTPFDTASTIVTTPEPSALPFTATGGLPMLGATPPAPSPAAAVVRRPAAGVRPVAARTEPYNKARSILLGLVITALAAWAWEAMQGSMLGGARGRPILSLYDAPPIAVSRRTTRHLGTTPRVGKPPSLR